VASAAAEFKVRLLQLEQILPGNTKFAAADHLTLADCGYPALLLYAEKMWPVLGLGDLDYKGLEKISRLRNVLWEDACVVKVLKELEPAAQQWINRKLAVMQP
jgi:glutathione S-transferase